MTNPTIDLAGPKAALQAFRDAPTATAEERATWGRDDARLHRERVNDHYLRAAFEVVSQLEILVALLEEAFGSREPKPPTVDEMRALWNAVVPASAAGDRQPNVYAALEKVRAEVAAASTSTTQGASTA